jgi:predicted phage terminase large subunit-like protein
MKRPNACQNLNVCGRPLRVKSRRWAEELGQIRGAIGPHLDRRIRERAAFVARQPFATRGDKSARAQSIRGRMALEGLYVPAGASWLADFRAELLSFPAGRHDDQVDAIALIGQLLDKMVPPAKPKPAQRPVRDLWDRDDTDRPGLNWKTI